MLLLYIKKWHKKYVLCKHCLNQQLIRITFDFQELSQKLGDDKSLSEHLQLPIQRINDYQLLLKVSKTYAHRFLIGNLILHFNGKSRPFSHITNRRVFIFLSLEILIRQLNLERFEFIICNRFTQMKYGVDLYIENDNNCNV